MKAKENVNERSAYVALASISRSIELTEIISKAEKKRKLWLSEWRSEPESGEMNEGEKSCKP